MMTLQQKSTKNISFLKEQINHENKAQSEQNLSDTELDAIRSSDVKILNPSLCKQDSIKNSKDTLESDRLFTELGAAGSLLTEIEIIKSFGIREEEFLLLLRYISNAAKCFALISDKFLLAL